MLAQGDYQKSVRHDYLMPMSQSSISRCVEDVTNAIVTHVQNHIHFPSTEEEKQHVSLMFPGIIGGIDCTQIAI